MQKVIRVFISYRKFIIFFFGLSFLLVAVWFGEGKLLASGEEGIPFYSPKTILQIYRYPWYETGTGYPMPVILPRVTFIGFTSFLSEIFPAWFVQGFSFWLLMVAATSGMFFLSYHLTKSRKVALFAGVFYVLNLYSQSQVWSRFLYTGMFAWAYLPLFLFLFAKWISEGKSKWLVFFLLSSFVFSNTFGHPAYFFTFWIPAILFTLFLIWRERKKPSKIINITVKALALFAAWAAVNVWWIYPYLKIGSLSFSEISGASANFDSLRGVSKYFTTNEILFLRQTFLFGENSLYYNFYANNWVKTLSLIVFITTIFGWLASKKTKYWLYFTLLAVVGWFVSKGANPPFGYEFFSWLFKAIPYTAVLRNPYEKFGLVFLLPYSIFFALGLNWIYEKLNPRIKNVAIGIIFFLSCGVLVWPMWNGMVIANKIAEVPVYYRDANVWLEKQSDDFRIFHAPPTPGDSVTYDWGYNGVEPSEFLFDKASVSKIVRASYFDEKYINLVGSFYEDGDFERFLDEMYIGYIVLHKDMDESVTWSDIDKAGRFLKESNNLELEGNFGKLDIYKYLRLKQNSLFETTGEYAPEISYLKKSPRRFIVEVRNATKPFTLIFKSTFNDLWTAEVDGVVLREHYIAYDYANGWKVDKKGNYVIDIVFKIWPWE